MGDKRRDELREGIIYSKTLCKFYAKVIKMLSQKIKIRSLE